MAITILLSDATQIGCEVFSRGVQRHAKDIEVVACAITVEEVMDRARCHEPEIVILSGNLHDGPLTGFSALRELVVNNVPSRIIMLFDTGERELVVTAFRGGARGVLVRDNPIDVFCKCVRRVHEGQIWAGTAELNYLLEAFTAAAPLRSAQLAGSERLTTREQEIVNLVAQGRSNREIAAQLHLSEHTVKNYLFRLFDKLGISSRVELANYTMHRERAA